MPRFRAVARGLAALRQTMDRSIIGHSNVKRGLLLGLVASEHIYIEGPPGIAKTMLARVAADAADMPLFYYQSHRDTRLAELVGDEVILREPAPGDGPGEIVRQSTVPGGVLEAELVVLDDVSRAPGEALNVLLQILNERTYGGARLPLRTAIATGNPTEDDLHYNEPLDPATLDRFTLHLRAEGMITSASRRGDGGGHWDRARSVVELYEGAPAGWAPAAGPCDDDDGPTDAEGGDSSPSVAEALAEASALLPTVALTAPVREGLLRVLRTLVEDHGLDDTNALLSDRTFLVNAVRVIKANALVEGRSACEPGDLHALALMTAFRIPAPLHDAMPQLVQEAIDSVAADGDCGGEGGDGDGDGDGGGTGPEPGSVAGGDGADGDEKVAPRPAGGEPGAAGADEEGDDDDGSSVRAPGDGAAAGEDEGEAGGEAGGDATGASAGGRAVAPGERHSDLDPSAAEPTASPLLPSAADDVSTRGGRGRLDPADLQDAWAAAAEWRQRAGLDALSVSGIDRLARELTGRIQRVRRVATLAPDGGGAPRSRVRARALRDVLGAGGTASASDVARWLGDTSPRLPGVLRRERRAQAGAVAVVRDVSGSMGGLPAAWASALALEMVSVAQRQRMKVGYVEFNHKAHTYLDQRGRFFTRDYAQLAAHAADTNAEGTTNYQNPLRAVLDGFDELQPRLGLGARRGGLGGLRGLRGAPPAAAPAVGDRVHALRDDGTWKAGELTGHKPTGYDRLRPYKVLFDGGARDETVRVVQPTAAEGGVGTRGAGRRRGSDANRHIILVTDGVPTEGDPFVMQERQALMALGVTVHGVYIRGSAHRESPDPYGYLKQHQALQARGGSYDAFAAASSGDFPAVLEALATETGGALFSASVEKVGTVRLERHRPEAARWAALLGGGGGEDRDTARARATDRLGAPLVGYGSPPPQHVTHAALKAFREQHQVREDGFVSR